jgi:hypothetical protein
MSIDCTFGDCTSRDDRPYHHGQWVTVHGIEPNSRRITAFSTPDTHCINRPSGSAANIDLNDFLHAIRDPRCVREDHTRNGRVVRSLELVAQDEDLLVHHLH